MTKAKQMLNILKALTSTKWGELKELIVSTFKAITCPILKYANNIWGVIYQTPTSKNCKLFRTQLCKLLWLHMRCKYLTSKQQNQGPSNGHPSQTSSHST